MCEFYFVYEAIQSAEAVLERRSKLIGDPDPSPCSELGSPNICGMLRQLQSTMKRGSGIGYWSNAVFRKDHMVVGDCCS